MNKLTQSIMQDQRPTFVSENYGFIPTKPIIEMLQAQGWELVETKERKALKPERVGFTKHRLVFEHPTLGRDSDSRPRVYITNSHDRTSAFTLNVGFFRFVCDNGLIIGDALGTQFKVYHSGRDLNDSLQMQIAKTLLAVPQAIALRDSMRAQYLPMSKQFEFAAVLSGIVSKIRGFEVSPMDLLTQNRTEDEAPDAWTVFNRIQENALGKLVGQRVELTPQGERRAMVYSRKIKSIETDTKLNTALFNAAITYLGVK